MVVILIGLLALVGSFSQIGKPASTPPHTSEEVNVRGKLVSEEAKNLETRTEGKVLADTELSTEAEEESSGTEDETVLGDEERSVKVVAFNSKSGKEMPTLLPQVAVDKSVALAGSVETGSAESEASLSVEGSANSEFGEGVSDSQPDSAKEDGKSFGQNTAGSAKERSNR